MILSALPSPLFIPDICRRSSLSGKQRKQQLKDSRKRRFAKEKQERIQDYEVYMAAEDEP